MKPETQQPTPDAIRVGSGALVRPLLAWEIEINYMSCVVFAETRDKAKWRAVRGYWDAFGKHGGWPSMTYRRRPELDGYERAWENRCWCPEHLLPFCNWSNLRSIA